MSQENHLSRISIVIPSVVSDLGRISSIVRLNSMDLFHQIIIVVSGIDSESEESLSHYFPLNNTGSNLSFVCVKDVLHPGQARNLGVKSVKTEYVSFLDARTSPSNLWFEFLSNFVKTNQQGLQLSSVQYIPTSFFAEVFVTATFGFLPLSCLPGSIVFTETFARIGSFISVRSGEDSEWISRSRLIGVQISESCQPPQLAYRLCVSEKTLLSFLRKWFRNYSVSFRLPGYQVHKYIYTILGSSIILLFFSMWNWRIAGWNESSPLYVPFLTRAALIIIALAYVLFRLIYMPIAKGVFRRRHPYLLILFSSPLAILLDIVKMMAGFSVVLDGLFKQINFNKL